MYQVSIGFSSNFVSNELNIRIDEAKNRELVKRYKLVIYYVSHCVDVDVDDDDVVSLVEFFFLLFLF